MKRMMISVSIVLAAMLSACGGGGGEWLTTGDQQGDRKEWDQPDRPDRRARHTAPS